jgi:serine protease inhibitor
MCGTGTFATVIELPYISGLNQAVCEGGGGVRTDTNLTAVFVLPSPNISLSAVIGALKAEPQRWGYWCAGLRAGGAKQYQVHVPIFALTQQAHGLRAALTEAVGVGQIFTRPDDAEANNLVRMTSTPGACVSEVVQASYLECSAGAARITRVGPDASGPRSELVRPLIINRPFLYLMVHAPTGAIMHMAKISRPTFLGVGTGTGCS